MRVLVALVFFGMTYAQRPFYAGNRPIGRPELANRFKENSTTETPRTSTLENRVGDSEITMTTTTTIITAAAGAATTNKIPVDARGDGQLVDRLNQWPREHRPFWLLNAEHIEASRNGQQQKNNVSRDNATRQRNSKQSTSERGSFNDYQDDQPFESYFEPPRSSSRPVNRFNQIRPSFLGPIQT